MKKTILIAGLDCAACAMELQEELEQIKGISEPSVDFVGQRVSLTYEDGAALDKAVDVISHFEEVQIIDENAPKKKESRLKEWLSIGISLLFFIPALVLDLMKISEIAVLVLYLCAFAAAGWSVVWQVIKNIPKAFRGGFHGGLLLDENLLMTIAAVGAFAIGEGMEGAIVMILYQIGELLQGIAVGSSRGAIEKLMALKSDSAILLEGDSQREVAPEELKVGDLILLRKGDRVPVDCKLLQGGSFDTKSVTGESYYREAAAGDEILSGCVNAGNAVKAEVVRLVSESAVAKILSMVENSTAKKAKPEKFITRFARIYTPVVVLLAVLIAVIPPLCTDFDFVAWIIPALNFLVISCPCALIISVPLTYFSGVGALARCGILTKGAVYLDGLAGVKVAAFDKTGTLTEGKFSVAGTYGDPRALTLAAALERSSSHPLAQAFSAVEATAVDKVQEIGGRGLSAVVGDKEVLVGSYRLMQEHQIVCEQMTGEHLYVYVAEDGKYLGCVEIEDKLRGEAPKALSELKRTGVQTIAVLTGDTRERAEASLKGLPVDVISAGLLPDEKPKRAAELKAQGKLLYVGDGINDTPVMAESDISVAMGALGSDAAIEASDFVLASDSLTALPKAIRGAKKTRKIVVENIVFSVAVKVAFMVLSLVGLLPLWAAVLGDTGVMLLAVLNSMRMRVPLK